MTARPVAAVRSVVIDNEAVQALLDVGHAKHARLIAILTEINRRSRRRPTGIDVVVPTAVRVEAGWDRTAATTANANRIARARDHALDAVAADRATQLRSATGVPVVDACVGQTIEALPGPVAVITSDIDDMTALRAATASGGDKEVRVVRL